MKNTCKELFDYICSLDIIDTHEHLPSKESDRVKDTDVLKEYLSHYINRDLVSAGLKMKDYQNIIENKLSISEKWKILEPFWEVSRYTGYSRSLDRVAHDIYGVDRIDGHTIEELNNKFQMSLQPGHYKKILKDKCRIKTSILNATTLTEEYDINSDRSIHCDRDFFSPAYAINRIVFPQSWNDIMILEKETETSIASFDNFLEVTEILINKAYNLGAVALKNGLSYRRTLKYERVTRSEAEEQFNNIFKTKHIPERPLSTGKEFQDYIFHYILSIVNKKNGILQIHTGIQEGSGNILSNSNPELLSNLFLEYPNVTFDLFHISYPYQNEITVLAKNFPNVFIDMCWAHIISPNASVNALLEWIDTVPLNKISAFGGDYLFIDGVYGHLQLAKEDVAKALSVKVDENLFDLAKAKKIAKMLFYDNPKSIYKL